MRVNRLLVLLVFVVAATLINGLHYKEQVDGVPTRVRVLNDSEFGYDYQDNPEYDSTLWRGLDRALIYEVVILGLGTIAWLGLKRA